MTYIKFVYMWYRQKRFVHIRYRQNYFCLYFIWKCFINIIKTNSLYFVRIKGFCLYDINTNCLHVLHTKQLCLYQEWKIIFVCISYGFFLYIMCTTLCLHYVQKKCPYSIQTKILSFIPDIDNLSLCHVEKVYLSILHGENIYISGID